MTEDKVYCIIADRQTNGRGTKGRKWLYGERNIYMTVMVHRKLVPIPFNLLSTVQFVQRYRVY
ncbi:hypothetical protein EON65_55260 [archaeon]|nr:MAG: hypothetical protein EON65_55260 [archaeon]